jgi:phage terminase large subunit-like protein
VAATKLTHGQSNIVWIEKHCRVPEGRDVGKAVLLREWQRDIIKGIYDNPDGTRRAIISFGRKNAKTTLCAFILLLHLCGPEARINSELFSSALSRDQAAILYKLAAKIVRMSPTLERFVVCRDTVKELACPRRGTLYRALSADASTNFGLSPVLVVHDELGQVRGPIHPLYDALETATGAQDNPLSVVISTQAATDNDLLSILIDDAKKNADPRTKLYLYTAPEDLDPFCEETIRLANPAFGDFQNERETLDMAQSARRMPSREANYRNLVLNQRIEINNPFITSGVWKKNGGELTGWGPVYGGLDLSQTTDLTALILVSPIDGILNVKSHFWLPADGLEERAKADRVPYDLWCKQGFLHTTPGRSVEYEHVANFIAELFRTNDIRKIAFDRWNIAHLRPWLIKAGLSESTVDHRFQDFGQGFKSMSPALNALEGALENEKLRHAMHPVLEANAANAVVRRDEAGGRKLDKRRSTGRIDGMVSLAMATSIAAADLHSTPVFSASLEQVLEHVGA